MEDQEYCSCGTEYGGEHRWTAHDSAVMARMVQYLDRSENMKVDIVELEYCLFGPQESEVDIRHIAMNARGKKRRRPFHIFCGQGQSEFLVVSAAWWDEYSKMRATQEEECQELSKVIKDMSERQGKQAPEELRKQIFQEIRDLAKKISGEELELFETKVSLEEWFKEGRDAEAEEGRAKVTAGGRVTRQAVAGSRSSESEI